jgi:hypothetical protein
VIQESEERRRSRRATAGPVRDVDAVEARIEQVERRLDRIESLREIDERELGESGA